MDTREKLAAGSWRTSETVTTFDADTGLATKVDDKGQIDANGDPVGGTTPEKCTTTSYAADTSRNMVNYPAQVITSQGSCGTSVGATTISATKTFYDGSTTLGKLTGVGDATRTQQLKTATPTVAWAAASTNGYDTYGRTTSTTDPLGRKSFTSYGTTATARTYLPVTKVATNAKGWQTTTTLDPGRQLALTTTDANGRVTTKTYDGLGRLTQVWLPNHSQTSDASTPSIKFGYTVTASTFVSVSTQTLRDNQTYGTDVKIYDGMLQLRQEQSMPLDGSTGARLIAATGYDSHGWITSAVQAFYNNESAPSTTPVHIDPSQIPAETRTTYDGQGRAITSAFYSNGARQWATTTAYPGADRTDTVPPDGGTPTTTITDARGQQTQVRQYHGATASGTYDVSYYFYDAAGHQSKLVGPIAQGDDPDSSKLVWTKSYDALGDVVTSTDPDTGTTLSTYDDDQEVVATTDGTNQTLTYDYDVLGRKTAVHNGSATGPTIATWTYDSAGAKGKLASSTAYASDGTTATWSKTIAGYTANYQPTGATTTIPAGAYGNTSAISYTTANSYTSIMGNLHSVKITESGAGGLMPTETERFSYNGPGLPLTLYGADFYEAHTDYDRRGRLIRATSGVMPDQVVVTNNWDEPTGRLLNSTVSKEDADAAVDSADYTYDPAGRVTSATDARDGGGADLTDRQCYRYDYLGRLTDVWTDAGGTHTAGSPSVPGVGGCVNTDPATASFSGPAPYWQSYSYDLTGNRRSRTDHAVAGGVSSTSTVSESYAGLATQHAVHTVTTGSTTTTYGYDGDGRPTSTATTVGGTTDASKAQTLTWTPTGRLDSLTSGPQNDPVHATGYGYDADGTLVARTVDGVTTLYLGDDTLTVTQGAVSKVARRYAFPNGPTAVRVATTAGTSLHWQAADPHGTGMVDVTADTLSVTRRTFTPFGQDRPAGDSGPGWAGDRGFVGGTQDATNGLTNLGAREYDPALGRFLNPDPLLDAADPQQWNGYAYANNTPTNASDPTGRMFQGDDGKGYGTAAQVDAANGRYARRHHWGHGATPSSNRDLGPVVHLSPHIVIYKNDPRYVTLKKRYAEAKGWRGCLWLCTETQVWTKVCLNAVKSVCPPALIAQLKSTMTLGAQFGDPLGESGASEFLAPGNKVRNLFDPKSMIGVSEDEIRAMVPDSWTSKPVKNGNGTRFLSPKKGKYGNIRYLKGGSPQVNEPIHQGDYVAVRIGGFQYHVAAKGNSVIKDPNTPSYYVEHAGRPGPLEPPPPEDPFVEPIEPIE